MLNITSTVVVESKAVPGVKYTLKKMTEGRRIKLRAQIAKPARRLVEILGDIEAERIALEYHMQQKKLAEENGIDFAETYNLTRVSELVTERDTLDKDEIRPAYLRWGLKSVDGLTIDGKPADAESIIENGSDEAIKLYEEMIAEIYKAAGLTERQEGESVPPTTSAD